MMLTILKARLVAENSRPHDIADAGDCMNSLDDESDSGDSILSDVH